ncbi:MAG: ABC transporter ATP-binding protein [Peptococcaceae bacterium]|jgi:oligopeptide/dipeptide ABC transporter ATP-binding protein|nr:ABC transporter ATP-binding protein [Peptococcaceae bacterium]
MSSGALLKVEGLKKYFPARKNFFGRPISWIKAVDGLDFEIKRGETFGIVGESGCGKSTAGRVILRLQEATAGRVTFEDKDVFALSKAGMKKMRTQMQIIFQDPYSSLNPKMNVLRLIACGMKEHHMGTPAEIEKRVGELLEHCGLSRKYIHRYPHEFSGGQRQRIGIARALALNPKFIVCDEPVSALDVSVQAQVINLLMELQAQDQLTYLFISHDLSVVKHISSRIGVIYLGSLVETAGKRQLFENPLHPYTRSLLSAIPIPDPTVKPKRAILEGDIPSPSNAPSGCKFRTRCPEARPQCGEEIPLPREIEPGHQVACHLV